MKEETITYEYVSNKIDGLARVGEKITVRNVLAETGGSAGKIADFVKRWKNEHRSIGVYNISDVLKGAILNENKIAVERALLQKNKELSDMQALLDELSKINIELEGNLSTEPIKSAKQETELIASNEKNSILENHLKENETALEKVTANLVISQQQLVEAATKIKDLEALVANTTAIKQELSTEKAKSLQLEKQLNDLYGRFKLN